MYHGIESLTTKLYNIMFTDLPCCSALKDYFIFNDVLSGPVNATVIVSFSVSILSVNHDGYKLVKGTPSVSVEGRRYRSLPMTQFYDGVLLATYRR